MHLTALTAAIAATVTAGPAGPVLTVGATIGRDAELRLLELTTVSCETPSRRSPSDASRRAREDG